MGAWESITSCLMKNITSYWPGHSLKPWRQRWCLGFGMTYSWVCSETTCKIYQSCQRHSWLLQAKVLSAPPVQPMGPTVDRPEGGATHPGHCTIPRTFRNTPHPGVCVTLRQGHFATQLCHCATHIGHCAIPMTLHKTPRILRNTTRTLQNTPRRHVQP